MEPKKIKQLLERYLEGNTSLSEESQLQSYFVNSEEIPSEWESYRMFFQYYRKAKKEHFPVKRIKAKKSLRPWMVAAAVGGVLLSIQFLVGEFTKTEDPINQQEMELAFQQFQENIKKVSNHLNKGTQNVAYLDYWNQTTQKFIK
ncbi:MAG: hypothetical protein VW080_09860 [Flavobacteriaceae bacterium]